VSGAVSYANRQSVFRPTSNLDCAKEYTATLTIDIADLADNNLADNYSWSFTTSCTPAGSPGTSPTTTSTTTDTATANPVMPSDNITPPTDNTNPNPASVDSGSSDNTSTPPEQGSGNQSSDNTAAPATNEPAIEVAVNLTPNTDNPAVLDLKQMLVDLGYLPNTIDTTDSIYDETTAAAVKQFQADNGLDSTGYVGPLTRAALREAWLRLSTGQSNNIGTTTIEEDGGASQTETPAEQTETASNTGGNIIAPIQTSETGSITKVVEKINRAINSVRQELAQSETAAVASAAVPAGIIALTVVQFAGQVNSAAQIPYVFLNVFGFLAYRRKRKAGLVYDAKTGQPVAFAKVTIYDKKTGQAKETKVTDKYGSYFFLAPKGEYTIQAQKKGYEQLTEKEQEKANTQYASPYTKGKVLVFEKDGLANDNIPIQKTAESQMDKFFARPQVAKLITAVFVIAFTFSVIMAVVKPNAFNLAVASLYIILGILKYVNLAIPQWGLVSNQSGTALPFTFISAANARTKELIGRTIADEHGRYAFILDQGNYSLNARTTTGKNAKESLEVKSRRQVVGKRMRVGA
jgi:peptidoglycan hydrolase-like protein with peptidoglycan-binding domain